MIKLYGIPASRSLRISWVLEELGLDWDYQFIDFMKGDNRSPEFLAVNPWGKVPAISDGELTLTESGAIGVHLCEKYGDGKLLPTKGSDQAARHHEWMFFITTELEQPLWNTGKHKFALPEDWRVAEMVETAKKEWDKAVALIQDRIPQEGYLLGDECMLADIFMAHTLTWAVKFKMPMPAHMEAYRERLMARPAAKSGLQKEFDGKEQAS